MPPRPLLFGLAGIALLLGAPPAVPAPDCIATEALTAYGTRFDPALELSSSDRVQTPSAGIPAKQAAFVKVKLVLSADDPRPWRVTLYDRQFHVVANFTPEDFRSAPDGVRWTGILPGDATAVLTSANDSPVTVGITGVVHYPERSADTRYFSTQKATPAWDDLHATSDRLAQRAGAAVGMIYGSADTPAGATVNWCCTGVMVSPDVMLTNHHCGAASTVPAWSAQVCENMVVDLARDDRPDVRQQYSCAKVLMERPDLDYALIRLKPLVGGSQYVGTPVYHSLAGRAADIPTAHLFAVHHAQCKPKLLSADCAGELASAGNNASQDELAHKCDTEPGASGAPVFTDDGRLLALHHRGFPRDGACKVVGAKLNYAVLLSRIVADLQGQKPKLATELGVPPAK